MAAQQLRQFGNVRRDPPRLVLIRIKLPIEPLWFKS